MRSQKWSNNSNNNAGGGNGKQLATSQLQYNSKQYDRIRVLGKGSFGTAVVHRRLADHSLVVLKEIDLQRFKGERERSSVIQEARIMSTLSHVNIIKYHNAYTTDTKLIIEMEYASMGTLATYLACQMEPLEEQEILIIFRQIVSGLAYLHSKNIIHLDLKMSNIFVTIDGLVKIGDFGIAQYMENTSNNLQAPNDQLVNTSTINKRLESEKRQQQQTSSHLGTLAYSSPERCLSQQTDFKSDIWSLGCILYELITSKPLFVGTSLPELLMNIIRIQYQPIRRNISSSLRETFEQSIARDPLDRPGAEDLLSITDQLLSRLQLMRYRLQSKRCGQSRQQRLDMSTEVALLAHKQQDDMMGHQINYLHSLIYQVRLDAHHIQVERVNLPPTKRIKEMSKGESHYLVLTYDNIVYGWGSKSCGQLGACGLSSVNRLRSARSSSVAGSSKMDLSSRMDSQASSLASSTQTIVAAHTGTAATGGARCSSTSSSNQQQQQHLSKQLVMSMLEESQPTSRPFIINELNHRKIIQVAAGNGFSVFLSKTGIVMTCGDGSSGCLGRGDLRSCFTPCMVESLLNSDVVSISCGPQHVMVVCGNGRAFAWGKNRHGRLGIGATSSTSSERPKYVLRPQEIQFPEEVFVRSVFCGDRSTIFIDDQNRCWASGENRFNKLGLDMKRRLKKTLIVKKTYQPTLIGQLTKYKIITCNIGKNHTTFLTSEGKLIVYGQDIDHSYRLRSNIISGRESHRRISFQLKTQRRLLYHLNPPQPPPIGGHSLRKSQRTSRRRRKQIGSYMKKSRASKKMPFECVISVSCRPKFTLALTNDNRVYFWGTRSHRQSDLERVSTIAKPLAKAQGGSSVEPQLVSSTADECFIKIAGTNNSLMTSIQLLGSDQPIIQAQDPRLMAKSLADLWILDYKPSRGPLNYYSDVNSSSSGSSCSCSSSLSAGEIFNLEESCSSCSLTTSLSNCSCYSCCRQEGDEEDEEMKHDAILEPQPIVSLYVPSMFNTHNNGYSLHMVDLFCFDEDKFYLILDTTIKWHQHGGGHSNSSRSTSTMVSSSISGSQQALLRKRPSSSPVDIINCNLTQTSQETQQQAPSNVANNQAPNDYNNPHLEVSSCCGKQNFESRLQFNRVLEEDMSHRNLQEEKLSLILSSSCDDINNNHNTAVSVSKGGVSLYEPRSLSTFAASLSNHIIVGPTMRLDQEQPLQPLTFKDDSIENDLEQQDLESQISDGTLMHHKIHLGGCRQAATSCQENSDRSMTNNDIETSSMPSWVRNEFIQCQQQQHQTGIFNIEPSNTDDDDGSFDNVDVDRETINDDDELTDRDDLNNHRDTLVENSPAASLLYAQGINLSQSELRNNYDQDKDLGQSNKAVGLFSSRSQPDISELGSIIRKQSPCSAAITRRASIIDELQEVAYKGEINANNTSLLQCNVYRNRDQSLTNQHLSSQLNFNSTLSSRSNSNSPLTNWPLSASIEHPNNHQQPRLVVETGEDNNKRSQTDEKHGEMNGSGYLWHEMSHQRQHFMSGEGFTSRNDNSNLHLHHHHRHSSINLPTASRGKTGSSSSLASLRKSLIKLFC